jgi:hypothetical protein
MVAEGQAATGNAAQIEFWNSAATRAWADQYRANGSCGCRSNQNLIAGDSTKNGRSHSEQRTGNKTQRTISSAPRPHPARNRKFVDSPLEGNGFELPVPGFSRAFFTPLRAWSRKGPGATRRSGKPSRTRNSSSFQAPRRIFTLPARHCELNGPNLVSLSPLSRAGSTLKPLSAGTR